ncbi:CbtB-domain containing protein [Salmonella enterica subsp. enterica serovar Virchow]|nr:CbtB-domain containing protein [Salmonella enterica subsp. enterica serovar Virchow]
MNTSTTNKTAAASASQTRLLQLALAGALGLSIVWLTGFASMDVAHNAAHDHRHSLAFPCH